MVSEGYYTLNNYQYSNPYAAIRFRGNSAVSDSQKNMQNPIFSAADRPIDTFVKKIDEEKKKKSNKTAVAVGSSVLAITALVSLLNPKYSSKIITKLKDLSQHAGQKLESSKESFIASKFYKATQKTLNFGIRTLEFTNNINSIKDIGFTHLCCEKKSFHKVKNKSVKNILQKFDDAFTNIMGKLHRAITRLFDSISKKTVQMKYRKSLKKMDVLENAIKLYKNKLPAEQQAKLEEKLLQLAESRKYFAESEINERLLAQEGLMGNLERDVMKQLRTYRNGFSNHWVDKKDHIDKNMTFWADKIMRPTRDNVESQGLEAIGKLVGNNDTKGLYNEIYEMISPHLSAEEQSGLKSIMDKTAKRLRKASHSECVEYFDKKRDLVLGSAPTDIVTATIGLGASAIAIASADSKEDRMSKFLTGGFPVVAGIASTLAFTAMLFSGVQGMLMGFGTSILLSKIGSVANHQILANKEKNKQENKDIVNNPFQPQEVMNA